jgi:predicted dehydrogenase
MTGPLGVGIIGCGNISLTYFRLAPLFRNIEIRACADLDMEVARERASQFGVRAQTTKQLLANDDISIMLNLTVPAAHYTVSRQILEAGKHVYSEKPLTLSVAEGEILARLASKRKLKVGCAPDTILGGAHQLARRIIDEGSIGRITSGTAHVMSPGMESWHPNPDFFFKPGGGPVLDLGPYYIGNLINLVGPVKQVAAMSGMARRTRTITSAPRKGQTITVKTPTTIHALLEFANGALITLSSSWDVFAHRHQPMELYGTEGAVYVPDPNFFGGTVSIAGVDGKVRRVDDWKHPLGIDNQETPQGSLANYRAAGLADLADAIISRRAPRCGIEQALHAVEVMLAILKSGETGRFVALKTKCSRPQPLGPEDARALLK